MGGAGLRDPVIAKYSMNNRTKKWTVHCIFHFLDFAAAASWLRYRQDAAAARLSKTEIMDYLEFKFSLAKALLHSAKKDDTEESASKSDKENPQTRNLKRRSVLPVPEKKAKHLPKFMNEAQKTRSRCRYTGCKNLTFMQCTSCTVFLCCSMQRNCFTKFHQ